MKTFNFDFMGKRRLAAIFSIVLLVVSIASLAFKQLSFGLDFTGGTLIEVSYQQTANLNQIRQQLEQAGYEKPVVQYFGAETDVLVRLPQGYDQQVGAQVLSTLSEQGQYDVELRRSEFVGAQVGEELREQGGLGLLLALGVVMIYVAMRFQLKFSLGAVLALGHDVLIVLGVFSLLGWNFDLTVLAALLAVIGYSLNDTIVVSDRIRENFRKMRKGSPTDVINEALNQTLGRTLVTSLTTVMVLMALTVFGGELIRGFSVALMIGVVIGTYSSIYVAANVLLALGISKEDLMVPVKEGADQEDMSP
ncbi:Protein-export membrane protein SecF [gamma proteobacterium IMCC2047]|nr:Protein-export membrane protein SecF [gamma proteobacterium IMCC2047]